MESTTSCVMFGNSSNCMRVAKLIFNLEFSSNGPAHSCPSMKWRMSHVPVSTDPTALLSRSLASESASSGSGFKLCHSIMAIMVSTPARAAQRACTREIDSRPIVASRKARICVAATTIDAMAMAQITMIVTTPLREVLYWIKRGEFMDCLQRHDCRGQAT